MLELFPDTARVEDGELTIGGVRASALAEEYGTPLVVYCEETVRASARSWRRGAPDATVVYGTKAFPNVALMRILAEEGIGADVSTLGELRFAQAAGMLPLSARGAREQQVGRGARRRGRGGRVARGHGRAGRGRALRSRRR